MFLQSISPRPAQPKEIAFELGASHDAIKKSLNRLYHHKNIERVTYGWYRSIYNLDDILKAESPEMRLHGIKIEGIVPNLEQASLSCHLLNNLSMTSSGNRRMGKFSFMGRVVTVQLSESGRVEIQIRGTKYPLNYVEFEQFAGWIDGISNGAHLKWNLMIVQLGIGRDFRTWELEGIKSIKWGQWRNAWAQIYQKTATMRAEIHINERLGLGDAIHILRGMTEPRIEQEGPIEPYRGPDASVR